MTAKKATPPAKKATVKAPVKNNSEPPPELAIKPAEIAGIQVDEPAGYATKTAGGVSRYTCLKCGVMFIGEDRLPMIRAHVGACKK